MFSNGQPDGYLREIYSNGSYYSGMWQEGWRHGPGKEVSSGIERSGIW